MINFIIIFSIHTYVFFYKQVFYISSLLYYNIVQMFAIDRITIFKKVTLYIVKFLVHPLVLRKVHKYTFHLKQGVVV